MKREPDPSHDALIYLIVWVAPWGDGFEIMAWSLDKEESAKEVKRLSVEYKKRGGNYGVEAVHILKPVLTKSAWD